jgi:hypothetical protein
MVRICACRSGGNWSMMRSTVLAAVVVCRVPKTRCPVSAVSMAMGDGFEIPHLAHQDDVRILAERGAERVLEALGVRAHLALVDQALAVLVHEFDRILDGHDVVAAFAVDESTSAASVVLLPLPVGPVTTTSPLFSQQRSSTAFGNPSCSGGQDLERDLAETRRPSPCGPRRSWRGTARCPRC